VGIGQFPCGTIRWKIAFTAAAILALFAVAYPYFHRAPRLTDKDTIILADFDNKTGDPVFDDTLRQGLSHAPVLNNTRNLPRRHAVRSSYASRGEAESASSHR
jgi:hypothetical protein